MTREYELVLMLDPNVEESGRDELAQTARGQIESGGELKEENSWGLRKMAYEIDQRTEADYRWFRFGAPTELLESLDHNLKITDGVLRFRIFRVDPDSTANGVPPAVGTGPRPDSDRDRPRGEDGGRGPRGGGERSERPRSDAPAPAAADEAPPAEAQAAEEAPPADSE